MLIHLIKPQLRLRHLTIMGGWPQRTGVSRCSRSVWAQGRPLLVRSYAPSQSTELGAGSTKLIFLFFCNSHKSPVITLLPAKVILSKCNILKVTQVIFL